MPVSHRFSRRAAAIGAALALAALPISATFTPAFAQPSPTLTAEADSTTDAEASAEADAASGDDSDSTADSTDGADADSSSADNGVTEVDGDDSSDPDPDEEGDKACKDPEWTSNEPCEIEGKLTASWDSGTQELTVTPNNNEPGSLPKSWENVEFDGPTDRGMVRIPAQTASNDDTADSAGSDSDTDDSGRSVAEATTHADAPTRFEFGPDGKIRAAGEDEPMKFTGFGTSGPNPEWTFTSDGSNIIASGEQYSDDDGAEASSDQDGTTSDDSEAGADGGTTDSDPAPTADGSTSSDGSSSDSNESADTDGVTAADGSTSESDAGTDGSSSDSDTSDDSTSSTDGGTSSDSGSTDRANTSGDRDSDGRDSDSDSGSGSDGSGSDSDSGDDDEADSNGAGSSVGASDADGTTPDPSTGNGSPDDERETIPGTAGDEWLPGDGEDAERPDYSDPVPRNPDEQTPKDDTDLITGGDQPSPRANQNPATSFGESIFSTIVSSWPIFVLAASGMAAVGFIIYLMGRRGKQD